MVRPKGKAIPAKKSRQSTSSRPPFIFVYITCPSLKVATRLAKGAVEKRLAACANILPAMTSVYRWQGTIETAKETVLILKTRQNLFRSLEDQIRSLHPYDCPCIVALPLVAGSSPYLDWLAKSAPPQHK
jgi:periplasmic divalent cation tolerance protein